MSCGDLIFFTSIIKLIISKEIVLLELKVKESERITCLIHEDQKNGNKINSKVKEAWNIVVVRWL